MKNSVEVIYSNPATKRVKVSPKKKKMSGMTAVLVSLVFPKKKFSLADVKKKLKEGRVGKLVADWKAKGKKADLVRTSTSYRYRFFYSDSFTNQAKKYVYGVLGKGIKGLYAIVPKKIATVGAVVEVSDDIKLLEQQVIHAIKTGDKVSKKVGKQVSSQMGDLDVMKKYLAVNGCSTSGLTLKGIKEKYNAVVKKKVAEFKKKDKPSFVKNQVSDTVSIKRTIKVTPAIAKFIKEKGILGWKPQRIKNAIKSEKKLDISTSVIYKIINEIYKTTMVGKSIGKREKPSDKIVGKPVHKQVASQMKEEVLMSRMATSGGVMGRVEDSLIAEIMENPGIQNVERIKGVQDYIATLAKHGYSANTIAKRVTECFRRAGKAATVSAGKIKGIAKGMVRSGKLAGMWMVSRFSGSADVRKSKYNATLKRLKPFKKGHKPSASGVAKRKATYSTYRSAEGTTGMDKKSVTAYVKRLVAEGIAKRRAYASKYAKAHPKTKRTPKLAPVTASEINAIATKVANRVGSRIDDLGGIEENPYPILEKVFPKLTARDIGSDALGKFAGILIGTNLAGLVNQGVKPLFNKVDNADLVGKWTKAVAGIITYALGYAGEKIFPPEGRFAPFIGEVHESVRTSAILYSTAGITLAGKHLVRVEGGVEGYISSLAERVSQNIPALTLEEKDALENLENTDGEVITIPTDGEVVEIPTDGELIDDNLNAELIDENGVNAEIIEE